ncbi:MAG: putative baseplate assembly protein, partial [Blastocatellia bacterium]
NDASPAFYLGFAPPANLSGMPNGKLSLYVNASGEMDANDRPEIEWQYSTGASKSGWASLTVIDATANFTTSGVIEFLAPPDCAPRPEFGETLYWLRAVRKSGKYTSEPRISALLLNTVMASHATRIENEVMGSSDGSKNQRFHTALVPVLEGQRLEVRELEMPSRMEQDEIKRNTRDDAISVIQDEAGRPLEIWVRWKQMADFYGSGPRDRHYVLDHLAGEVRFGDGISGMIPPIASGNIRMASYRTGGGQSGNKPAGAITQLRTSLAYVEGVTNYVESSGGAAAEAYESLVERMPRMIRHGGRAVTYEDYEDLAMLASPDVARARSVRFYEKEGAGKVRLIVVPRSTDSEPVPTLEMKRRVQEFIDERKSPLVQLTVVKPEYVEVGITVEIAPTSLEIAGELKLAVLEKITCFLHPLTGGFEGEGWDFSRQPHDSDLYYLIEQIAGVDHVISLKMTMTPPGPAMSEYQLIASGKHEVTCRF